MFLNLIFDSSVNSAPAGFIATVNAVAAFLSSNFSDNITINVKVGYGEVNGTALSSGALGESEWFLQNYSYSAIRNALISDSKTADDQTSTGSLPISEPGNWWVTTAEAKALGLMGPSSSLDGSIGFSSTAAFDFDRSDGISAGKYDFFGTVAHELTEVMGRALLVGDNVGGTTNSYLPLDLFHYVSAGVHLFSGTSPGYFSIDNGLTNLANFNTNPAGDAGDWSNNVGADAFLAFSNPGVINAITDADLRVLDVIGFDRVLAGAPPPLNGDQGKW
jgi:hypothetical protein